MRYLGGKYKLGPKLRAAMEPYLSAHAYKIWEPFCGGLGFSRQLGGCTGLLSDVHAPLICTYQAYRAGWRPPTVVTPAMYEAAKSLPDTDPLKAFIGFGCSWSGVWFAGHVHERNVVICARGQAPRASVKNTERAAAASLAWLTTTLARMRIQRVDYLETNPHPTPHLIYCDPPYAGTNGYDHVGAFDHDRFWRMCQAWARHTTVLVSEYACPVAHTLLLATTRAAHLTRHAATDEGAPVERLFLVHRDRR